LEANITDMKRPNEDTIRMLQKELDKLIAEVNEGASLAEQFLVTMLVVEQTQLVLGLPNDIRRRVFEILYRYFALIEGLEKK
jgi:hypothetical protein